MLGSVAGVVATWADTEIVATAAANAATGSVRVQQNGIWSNALQIIVPTEGQGNAVTMVPNVLGMLVGESRTLQALNATGQPVQGLTWNSRRKGVGEKGRKGEKVSGTFSFRGKGGKGGMPQGPMMRLKISLML